jgi:hypothetical protein
MLGLYQITTLLNILVSLVIFGNYCAPGMLELGGGDKVLAPYYLSNCKIVSLEKLICKLYLF